MNEGTSAAAKKKRKKKKKGGVDNTARNGETDPTDKLITSVTEAVESVEIDTIGIIYNCILVHVTLYL